MAHTHSILIVEDDAVLREAYRRRFSGTPYDVRTAENGAEAIAMIGKKAPDLLICDIMMPVRDGWWVLEQCPRDGRTFQVLMLTNVEEPGIQKRLQDAGADGYLVKKNMSLRSLVEKADELLGSHHA